MMKYKVKVFGLTSMVKGELLLYPFPLSFLGDVDPNTGRIAVKGFDRSLKGKILLIPEGKGSSVGAYVLFALKKRGNSPLAVVTCKPDITIASGCIVAEIPYAYGIPENELDKLSSYKYALLDPRRNEAVFSKTP